MPEDEEGRLPTMYVDVSFSFHHNQIKALARLLGKEPERVTRHDVRRYIADRIQNRFFRDYYDEE